MPVHLCVERQCRWLALGADTLGPWGMLPATGLDATINVLQSHEFTTIHSRSQFPNVRVEGQVLQLVLLQVSLVPWFELGAVDTATVGIVTAPGRQN